MLERETEQRSETSNDDWLKAVYVMGVILFFAPPVLFFRFFSLLWFYSLLLSWLLIFLLSIIFRLLG